MSARKRRQVNRLKPYDAKREQAGPTKDIFLGFTYPPALTY